jgi:putative methyltransferase (TIGR04325 family)
VLQYLERPYEMLEEMLEAKFDFILIDRTPYSLNNEDVIKLQKVPPSIYKASYPCWFLSEMHLKDYLIDRDYKLIEEFDSIEGRMNNYTFKGMIWKKND